MSSFQEISSVGRKKLAVHSFILLLNVAVLALSARVNIFQGFYYAADLLPFGLSIFTGAILALMIALDLSFANSFTGWPQFEIASFAFLSLLWLAFNSFSTSRWRNVPLTCHAIPDDYSDWRSWCLEVNVLRAIVWIELVIFVCTWITTLRYAANQSARGNQHIYKTPLSRYQPVVLSEHKGQHQRGDSEFFQSGITESSFQRLR